MPIEWERATDDVLDIADDLIIKYHPHLIPARIGFIFRNKAIVNGDAEVWAETSRVSAKLQTQVGLDYLVWVAKDVWESLTDPDRKAALIDHELCHCVMTERGTFGLRDHDVQEFVQIVERYGLWTHSLSRMNNAMACSKNWREGGKVIAWRDSAATSKVSSST